FLLTVAEKTHTCPRHQISCGSWWTTSPNLSTSEPRRLMHPAPGLSPPRSIHDKLLIAIPEIVRVASSAHHAENSDPCHHRISMRYKYTTEPEATGFMFSTSASEPTAKAGYEGVEAADF